MVGAMRSGGLGFVCLLVTVGGSCAAATVPERQEAAVPAAPVVAALVELPVSLGYGGEAEQRRVQRRTGDALIALAGGHVILAEELGDGGGGLTVLDDRAVADRVRAMGEAPQQVLTFAVLASRSARFVPNASPLPGLKLGRRAVMDYIVRLEVRQVGRPDVLGTIDGVASGALNGPEVGPRGESLGVQKAIDDALAKAVRAFAPGLQAPGPVGGDLVIAEVPAAAAASTQTRLRALQDLYPELSIGETQALVSAGQRLLVIRPGTLAAIGLQAGDLVGLPVGQELTTRAALARSLARGAAVKLVVERAGQKYLLAAAEKN
jgi:hypothetical protein